MAVVSLSDAVLEIGRSPEKFYVYVLHRADGPFYVGKGNARRIAVHEEHARTKRRGHKLSIIRGLMSGAGVGYELVAFFDCEADAFAEEARLIASIGRRDHGAGSLVNLTDGGEGPVGLKHTDEAREKMRRAKSTQEQRLRSSAIMTANNADPVFLSRKADAEPRRRESVAAHQKRPEHRASQSGALKTHLANNPEALERRKEQLSSLRKDPKILAAYSAGTRKAWANPEGRSARVAALVEAANRPEVKERKRQQMLRIWAERKAQAAKKA